MISQHSRDHVGVAIIGGGPIGLFLACCLQHKGVPFVVLDRRRDQRVQPRVAAIHPEVMRCFDRMDLMTDLSARGVRVVRGRVFRNQRGAGVVEFASRSSEYPFLLSLSQSDIERILGRHLWTRAPEAVRLGATVQEVEEMPRGFAIMVRDATGAAARITASFLIACDGRESQIRRDAGIRLDEVREAATFIMGDFEDEGGFGDEARVFVDSQGFLEATPLPGGLRRWVVQTPRLIDQPDEQSLCEEIRARTGVDLRERRAGVLSAFEASTYIASSLSRGRLILAAESAHAVHPIGSQGVNLGWSHAWQLAETLQRLLAEDTAPEPPLAAFESAVRARLEAADRQMEAFLTAGRIPVDRWSKFTRSLAALRPSGDLASAFFTLPAG